MIDCLSASYRTTRHPDFHRTRDATGVSSCWHLRSAQRPSGRLSDRRQLLLPVVLPHEGMLPDCLIEIAPDTPAATALISASPITLFFPPKPVPNTSLLAAAARHSRTRRCSVRSWPSGKMPGCSSRSRKSNSFAVRSGSASSHARTSDHTSSNGSFRVRQSRHGFGCALCVGRTSPVRHAVLRPEEALEVSVVGDRDVHLRAGYHRSELVLDGADLVEQPKWVERRLYAAQALLRCFCDRRGGE
jgi:hypothetical protein